MTGLRWSRRTTTTIAEELAKLGIVVSPNTVARLCVYSKFARRTAQAELRATSTSRAAAMEKAVRAGAQLNLLTCLSVTNSHVAKNTNQSLAIIADPEF